MDDNSEADITGKTEQSPARFYVSMGPGGAALHAVGATLESLPNVSFGVRLPGATKKQAEDLADALNQFGPAIFGLIVLNPEMLDDMGVDPDEAFVPPSARAARNVVRH